MTLASVIKIQDEGTAHGHRPPTGYIRAYQPIIANTIGTIEQNCAGAGLRREWTGWVVSQGDFCSHRLQCQGSVGDLAGGVPLPCPMGLWLPVIRGGVHGE